ncbi:sulfotransferase 1A1-like [Biomphalaria glabrata]|uniref:Sulfotransferase 1A1-like n=1 Tax=Biomphalaria glabrata TaxID=6526 RepID=A0A9W2YIN1_BIOGL|nr:sulfotransferase 1A1-like [Biomphalaria glabrata]XP_055862539.1 sulfotransferase 1A1-like [Biomphalaria glabrata]
MDNPQGATSSISAPSSSSVAPEEFLNKVPRLAQLTDRFGNTFHFGNAGDYWHQAFAIGAETDYKTHVKQIRNMDIRDDDILICSYPKSGLHWHCEVVKLLMNKSKNLSDGDITGLCFLDAMPSESFSNFKSPRLLVTHVPFRHIPKQALEKKIKILVLERNPKDVLVSYYNHVYNHLPPLNYPGTFEQFFQVYFEVGYLYGDVFDYVMEWQTGREANPKLHFLVSVFEDMKADTVSGVKRLNTYLGSGCSDELCEQIAAACSFEKMKKHKDETVSDLVKALFRNNKLAIYRKGEVGDWKNWFTVAMNEQFDKEYEKRMSDYKSFYTYTL